VADPGCLSGDPGFNFFPSRIPDPGSELSPSRIQDPGSSSSSKNLSILTPKKAKKWFLSSKKYDPGCSRIPDPDADFLPSQIPDTGSRGQKSTQSRIPDPDPQHWFSGILTIEFFEKELFNKLHYVGNFLDTSIITINVPLFKKLRDIIFLTSKLRGQKSLGPLKMSLEMAHKVIVPQQKIRSQSFLNSGTLVFLCT
jgi:hypothetical protein